MHFTKFSKIDYISRLDHLFSESFKDDKIKLAVFKFGYTEQRLEEGRVLFNELNRLVQEHSLAMKNKADINHQKQQLYRYVNKQYMKYLKIARIAFDSHIEAHDSLMLDGVREKTFGKWFAQVSVFCNNLLAIKSYWPYLESYGIKVSQIEELKRQLSQLELLSEKAIQMSGNVKMLTVKKNEQTLNVQSWISDYIKIARIALEDAPTILKKLGLGVNQPATKKKSD
ncbi:MAG: hypothetical protein QM786_09345 [Breznakibacter sp.]